jgi:hypothetical protein
MALSPNTSSSAELAGRAVALMTAWASSPDNSSLLTQVWESFNESDPADAATGTLTSIGFINLCGVLLMQISEETGLTVLEVLAAQGAYWANIAAEESP